MDAVDAFRLALGSRGIIAPDVIKADGLIHRCRVEGARKGKDDASYLLHLDGIPAGGFENFRDGLGWQNWHAAVDREWSPEERAENRRRMDSTKAAQRLEEFQRRQWAQNRATAVLSRCHPATNDHPYLVRKGVRAYGVQALREKLVIPLRDAAGLLWSLQFIGPDGSKRFLTGGKKRGCYFAIGRVSDVLCVCEGYATAASVFESTGHATAVAFDAGNLGPVALALRSKFPGVTIVIAADNDSGTPGNPGVTHALEAARAVNGRVAVPSFAEATV
jgi:putative DNA primase/helicase